MLFAAESKPDRVARSSLNKKCPLLARRRLVYLPHPLKLPCKAVSHVLHAGLQRPAKDCYLILPAAAGLNVWT